MSEGTILLLARDFLRVSLVVAGPALLVSLVVGLLISILQVLTSVQDITLTYVARILAMVVLLAILGRWMLHGLATYTRSLWLSLPGLVS